MHFEYHDSFCEKSVFINDETLKVDSWKAETIEQSSFSDDYQNVTRIEFTFRGKNAALALSILKYLQS